MTEAFTAEAADHDALAAVTVVVACYRSATLGTTLASIKAQTYPDFTVLVVDDALDETVDVEVAALADSRFHVLHTPGSLGPAGAHALGMQHATTEFAAFLNHDDEWLPDFLRTTVAVLERVPDAVLVFTDHLVMDALGVVNFERSAELRRTYGRDALPVSPIQPFHEIVRRGSISIAQASLFRTNALSEIPRGCGQVYDRWVAAALASTGGAAVFVDQSLARWREHSANLTSAPRSATTFRAQAFLSREMVRLGGFPPHRQAAEDFLRAHIRLIVFSCRQRRRLWLERGRRLR